MRPLCPLLLCLVMSSCGPPEPGAYDAGASAGGAELPNGGGTAIAGGSATAGGSAGGHAGGATAGGAQTPTCGDGVCSATETCTTCARDCGTCCTAVGGLSCGGNGIEGNADTLYRCDGTRYVASQQCGAACVQRPSGVPDRCPLGAPPASLVTKLSPKPYVEQSCTATTFAGWPYAAKKCTYSSGPLTTSVTVADPEPAAVAKWIVDAAAFIKPLRPLQTSAPAQWEQALGYIALHMLYQSSRIFPLEGGIIEDMGTGYVNYPFSKGVTQGCSSGCYCRINSLHRTTYCEYRSGIGVETQTACLNRVGSSGLTTGWGNQCLQSHIDAWTRDWNEHFRAHAWKANQSVSAACGSGTCSAQQVVDAVKSAYGL
ncbi:MAG: hypothetical protein IPJ65_22920 [Archangiaceae bacterium]|nr:hypothetical protein [Archangiaceae bacterium]